MRFYAQTDEGVDAIINCATTDERLSKIRAMDCPRHHEGVGLFASFETNGATAAIDTCCAEYAEIVMKECQSLARD